MIRDIRKLEEDIKVDYGIILGSMLLNLKDADVFHVDAFYKILAYTQIPKRERKKILDFLLTSVTEEIALYTKIDALLEKVKGQERDVLRFSLMQDLLSLAKANQYVSEDKKLLLEQIQEQLIITDEQMKIFEDAQTFENSGSLQKSDSNNKVIFAEKFNSLLALGIPLIVLYFSKHNAYRHNYKSFTLLRLEKKFYSQNSSTSLAKNLLISGVLYKGISWGLHLQQKKQSKLEKMLTEEFDQINARAKKYLIEDSTYCEKIVRKNKLNKDQMNISVLFEKAQNFMCP